MGALERIKRTLQSLSGLERALGLAWRSGPGWSSASALLVVVQGLLPLATLYLLKLIVDGVAAGLGAEDKAAAFGQVMWLVVLTAGVALTAEVTRSFSRVARDRLSDLVTDRVYDLLHAKSIEVDLESYEHPDYYDALYRAHHETPFRPTRILIGFLMLGQSLITIVAIAGWLFSVDWRIGLILVLSSFPALWARVTHAARVYAWRHHRTPLERKASYFDWLLADPTLAKEVRLFELGPLFAGRFSSVRALLRREKFSLSLKRCVWDLATDAVSVLAIFGSYGFIAYRAVQGLITVGDVAMFYQAFLRVQNSLRELMTYVSGLYEDRLFFSTLTDFLEHPVKIVGPADPKPLPTPMQTGFAFHDVSFRYPESERNVLEDVSLEIRPKEVIALVGENGSGKTTLVKLLCRLYDPSEGVITLDGTDLREFEPRLLRREIAVILQDYGRYSLSVRENIWFGNVQRPAGDDGTVVAARRAGAHDVISSMPEGYDTVLGKRFQDGTELSVGDWQKVALARTFFHDAQLIVLDEPTSSMDAHAEYEVLEGFRRRLHGAAAILISHRLSTMRLADRIFVLDKGRIVETGAHLELLERKGVYARLFDLQARPYREGRSQ